MESSLQRTYQECFNAIENLKMDFSFPRKFHSMNPEMYDFNGSQQLLEAAISKASETQLSILMQRKPDPDTCDSLGKYVIEYMFEQQMYIMVINMLKHGAILPKSILKTCLTRNICLNNNRYKHYSVAILKAATSVEMLSKEELHDILNKKMNTTYKEKFLNTSEIRVKMINLFLSRLQIYQDMLNKCMEP